MRIFVDDFSSDAACCLMYAISQKTEGIEFMVEEYIPGQQELSLYATAEPTDEPGVTRLSVEVRKPDFVLSPPDSVEGTMAGAIESTVRYGEPRSETLVARNEWIGTGSLPDLCIPAASWFDSVIKKRS